MHTIDSFKGDHEFLSNFHVEPCGLTNEHRFQACKPHRKAGFWTHVHGADPFYTLWQDAIMHAETAGKAKRLGRKCPLRKNWNAYRYEAMKATLLIKFSNPELLNMLFATENALLIEGNHWHDNYWGNCFCRKCKSYPGMNMLGVLLMSLRSELRGDHIDPTTSRADEEEARDIIARRKEGTDED